jgi:hypothetical protein
MLIRASQVCLPLLMLSGCALFAGSPKSADTTLWPLQLAIERELAAESGSAAGEASQSRPAGQSASVNSEFSSPIPVAVLAVVDSTALEQAGETAGAGQPLDTEAMRRERLVHQALSSALVNNALIEVIQPEQASLDQARGEMIAVNSAALSAPTAEQLGENLGAEILICALIDRNGAEVNVVAQRASDGKLVYHDTIKDWDILANPEQESE